MRPFKLFSHVLGKQIRLVFVWEVMALALLVLIGGRSIAGDCSFSHEPQWEDRQKADIEVRAQFKTQFAQNSQKQKRELIDTLIKFADGQQTNEKRDAALHDAVDIAASLGDYALAEHVVSILRGKFYYFDEAECDFEALKTAWPIAADQPGGAARIASGAMDLIDLEVSTNEYKLLDDTANISRAAAARAGCKSLVEMVDGQIALARAAEAQYAPLPKYEGRPAMASSDEQHLTIGRYVVFSQQASINTATNWLVLAPKWNDALSSDPYIFAPSVVFRPEAAYAGAKLWWDMAQSETGTAHQVLQTEAAEIFNRIPPTAKEYGSARKYVRKALLEGPNGAHLSFWSDVWRGEFNATLIDSLAVAGGLSVDYSQCLGTASFKLASDGDSPEDLKRLLNLAFNPLRFQGDCEITSDFRYALSVGLLDMETNRCPSLPLPHDGCWHRIILTRKGTLTTCKIDDDAPVHVSDDFASPAYFMITAAPDHRLEIRDFGVKLPEGKK
jgi:hypothetical protein